jgi:hypothetical protein
MLEEAALQSKGIHSGFYCPMSAPAIFFSGYGLPFTPYGFLLLWGKKSIANQENGLSTHSN